MVAMWSLLRLQMLRELELRGTIGQVAEALGYSPSSVSQHLAQLEREVGVALLAPDGRRVRLTTEGRRVARHGEEVMRLEEVVRAEIGAPGPPHARLRVATLASATRTLLPRALDLIAASDTPGRIELAVVAPEEGLAELESRHYDLVIAEQYPGHTRERREGVDYRHLGHDSVRIAVPPAATARNLLDLRERPWVLEPPGSAARHWAVEQCRAAGFEPDVRFEATDLGSHIALIAAGHAVGILPDLVWADEQRPVRLLELPARLHREIFTAVRASAASRPDIDAFRAALAASMSPPAA